MNSRKRRADVSVRELQLAMESEGSLCQAEIGNFQKEKTSSQNGQEDTMKITATAESREAQLPPLDNSTNPSLPSEPTETTPEVTSTETDLKTESTAAETGPIRAETSAADTPAAETPAFDTAKGEAPTSSTAAERAPDQSASKETPAEEGASAALQTEAGVEANKSDDASTPFKIDGSVFSSLKLPSLPLPTPEATAASPESPNLELKEGGEEEKVGSRPKSFPGEEDEDLIYSEAGVTLLKCVNVATEDEPAKFKFKALGNGIVRLLKGSDGARLIFRQNGTWHLLLNSPLELVTKPENIDTPSAYLIKFFAYDLTKESESNKLSVYCLKFPEAKSRDELQGQIGTKRDA